MNTALLLASMAGAGVQAAPDMAVDVRAGTTGYGLDFDVGAICGGTPRVSLTASCGLGRR